MKIDQSVSHNSACLTVVKSTDWHRVTAVEETLRRTNLGELEAWHTRESGRCHHGRTPGQAHGAKAMWMMWWNVWR
ncbi:MAG: hypothetical protein IPH31_23360 [Lewinellaceae bacterium]|nr:hypothetical protein [Lewinellaceae bacterium]